MFNPALTRAMSHLVTHLISLTALCLLVISQSTTNNSGGLDPIVNFCVRIDHQCKSLFHEFEYNSTKELLLTSPATIKNGVLYIDGGMETFAEGNNNSIPIGNIIYGYSTFSFRKSLYTRIEKFFSSEIYRHAIAAPLCS